MVLSAISSLPHRPLECPQCHWQDWIRTVLQEMGKLGECLGCSRPSRWWWSDMGVVAGRRGGGCDEGPHSWCATDAHYAAFCSPFLNLHKCFRHLHLCFFHVQKYLSLFHNFIIISKNVHLFFPSTRKSTYTRILWEVHFINCEHPSGWFNTLLTVEKNRHPIVLNELPLKFYSSMYLLPQNVWSLSSHAWPAKRRFWWKRWVTAHITPFAPAKPRFHYALSALAMVMSTKV